MAATGKPAAQEPLDKLETQVNNVLFQLGRIFKHAHQGDRKALEQAKTKAAKGIPDADAVFQKALDDLEMDLTKAFAVVCKDHSTLQERRAAREKAAGAARLQAKNANGTTAANSKAIKKEPGASEPPKKDVEMTDQRAVPNGQAADRNLEEVAAVAAADIRDLDALFNDDSFVETGPPNVTSNGGEQQGNDHGIDDLFADDINFAGDFGMSNEGGSGDGISNLLPGLEKYVNQGQEGANAPAPNGQIPGNNADDIDLEALLDGITDNGGGDPKPETAESGSSGKNGQKMDTGVGGDGGSGATHDAGKSGLAGEKKPDDAGQDMSLDVDDNNNDGMDFMFGDFDMSGNDTNGMAGGGGFDDLFNFD